MRVREIEFSRTARIGNGEIEKLGASATLEKGENPDLAFITLKEYVYEMLKIKNKTAMQIAFEQAEEKK